MKKKICKVLKWLFVMHVFMYIGCFYQHMVDAMSLSNIDQLGWKGEQNPIYVSMVKYGTKWKKRLRIN